MDTSKEIWRDEKTGLPMHSHPIAEPTTHDDGTMAWIEIEPRHKPCSCSIRAYDVPLPAAQQSNKEAQEEQRP